MYEDGLHTTYINVEIDDGLEITRLNRQKRMKDMNKRIYKYDVLRTIAILNVILLHISAVYIDVDYSRIQSVYDYYVGTFFNTVSRTAVPCFVMLSGAFLICKRNREYGFFYKKMFKKIIIPTIVFSVLYVLYAYAQIFMAIILNINISKEKLNLYKPLLDLLAGHPHVIMWYMYMLVGLYAITPILVRVKESTSKKEYVNLGIILLVYGIIVNYTSELVWIAQFNMWGGYYVLGNVLKESLEGRNKVSNCQIKGIVALCVAFIFLFVDYILRVSLQTEYDWTSAFSPFIMASTFLIFYGISLINFKHEFKIISYIGKKTLIIYLIHILLIDPVAQVCGRIIRKLPNINFIVIYAIIVMMLCLGIDYFINKLKKFLQN